MALPCEYCGKLTVNFCDGQRCEDQPGFNNMLCCECETEHRLSPACIQAGSDRFMAPDEFHLLTVTNQTDACARCLFPKPRYTCSRCTVARYCDRKCQKRDWARHKALTCVAIDVGRNEALEGRAETWAKSVGFTWNYKYRILQNLKNPETRSRKQMDNSSYDNI